MRDSTERAQQPIRTSDSIRRCCVADRCWLYVESLIVEFLEHPDPWVRGACAIAAGHVARIHRVLTIDRIVPLIERLLNDSGTSGKAQDALDDIRMFLGDR